MTTLIPKYDQGATGASNRPINLKLAETLSVQDFGAVGDGTTDDSAAFIAAINAATADQVILVPASSNPYVLANAITLGASGTGARLVGMGQPTIKFTGIGSTTDCLTISGASMRQCELRNLIINCNTTGQDGVVLTGSDHPHIDNVIIKNSKRDGFVISCSGSNFVENGEFELVVQTSGRHGVAMRLAGSGNAFINECLWRQLEIRGVSAITSGANAINISSTASGSGSKFSTHNFIKSNIDAQYVSPNPAPSSNIVEVVSGNVENWRFISGGWENTGATPLTGGYAWAVSGTGYWGGLTVDSIIFNSYWGNLGAQSTILQQWIFDYSFSKTTLTGPISLPTAPIFSTHLTTSLTNATGDGTVVSYGSTGTTKDWDNHNDVVASAGSFLAPTTGVYEFYMQVSLSNLSSSHTYSQLGVVVNGGTYAGTYYALLTNPYQNSIGNSGNLIIYGTIQIKMEAGIYAYPVINVNNGTKTVGITGGFITATRFAGYLIG